MKRRRRLGAWSFGLCLLGLAVLVGLGACERLVDWRALSSGECPEGEKPCPALQRCVRMDDPSTGCADLTTCAPCTLPHATATCGAEGACVVADCLGNHLDCDETSPGCETDSTHDPDHCDKCNQRCTAPNGFPGCSGGHCTLGGCYPGFADCNSSLGDGCETPVWTEQRCGGCNAGPCPLGLTCVKGVCCEAASSCAPGTSCDEATCCAPGTCCRAGARACSGPSCCTAVSCPEERVCTGKGGGG